MTSLVFFPAASVSCKLQPTLIFFKKNLNLFLDLSSSGTLARALLSSLMHEAHVLLLKQDSSSHIPIRVLIQGTAPDFFSQTRKEKKKP